MAWNSNEAERACGDLLAILRDALPHIGWERADAAGDDGMIRFTNSKGQRVKVIVTREALQDYLEADNRIQSRKDGQLAECLTRIDEEGLTESWITSEYLAP